MSTTTTSTAASPLAPDAHLQATGNQTAVAGTATAGAPPTGAISQPVPAGGSVVVPSVSLSDVAQPPLPPKMALTDWKKRVITIILIGETGVGKTAFMSLLSNICIGRELEQFESKEVKSNEAGGSSTGSQTNKPVLYKIECANGCQLRILDTPGLADTRGVEEDNKHKQSIANAIKDQIEAIDAVVVLANGTLARLGVATEYTLTVISGMFPNSVVDNIGFLFTMVPTPLNFNFQRAALPEELRKARLWTIDNPLAQLNNRRDQVAQDPSYDEDGSLRDDITLTYKKSLKTLNDLFKWLDERNVQPVKAINDLYNMTTEIEASISNVIARMNQKDAQVRELNELAKKLTNVDQIKFVNSKFKEIMKKPFWEHEPTPNHNTLCTVGNCYQNCHEDCTIGFTDNRADIARLCGAFDDRLVCKTCHHAGTDHQHFKSKWVKKEKDEEFINPEALKRYNEATTAAQDLHNAQNLVQTEITKLEQGTIKDEEELSTLCESYNKLALSGSFTSYISSAIRLLKLREEKMVKDGADADAIKRNQERVALLEAKRKVVEEAARKKREQNKASGLVQSVKNLFK